MDRKNGIESILQPGRKVTDWGRMESAQVRYVAEPQNETHLIQLVRYAKQNGLKITLRAGCILPYTY